MNSITLELPLPPQILHPNGRTRNQGYRASMIRKTRGESALVAKMLKPATCPWEAATVHLEFHMPRRKDEDGLVSWCKAIFDGIADAGVVVNDSVFRTGTVEQVTGKNVRRKLVLRIERD